MTAFTQNVGGNLNLSGSIANFRWYFGAFKYLTLGKLRAVYRTVKLITLNRNIN